jgi:hypothetical protein
MALLKLSDTLGNIHRLDFAMSVDELPYSRKVGFEVACEDIALWALDCEQQEQEQGDQFIKDDAYYCYLLCKAMSKYLDYDMAKIMAFDTSDIIDSHGNFIPAALEKNATKIDLKSAESTLHQLYTAAREVIGRYRFELRDDKNYTFEHDGQQWAIPHVVQTLFDGRKVFSSFSTAQAVETMMIRNYLDEHINQQPREKVSADQVANTRYTAHLTLIAICVAPVGKDGKAVPLPLDSNEFDIEVAKRVQRFATIDTKTAQDVVFFLMNTTMNSEVMRKITTILTPQQARVQNG